MIETIIVTCPISTISFRFLFAWDLSQNDTNATKQAVVVWCVVMKVPGENTHSTVVNAVDRWFIKLLFVATKTSGDQSDSSVSSLVDSLSTASLLSKGGI